MARPSTRQDYVGLSYISYPRLLKSNLRPSQTFNCLVRAFRSTCRLVSAISLTPSITTKIVPVHEAAPPPFGFLLPPSRVVSYAIANISRPSLPRLDRRSRGAVSANPASHPSAAACDHLCRSSAHTNFPFSEGHTLQYSETSL